MGSSLSEMNQWKKKALGLARELEAQQALKERNEKRLVRALIRLTLACEGGQARLDPHLLQLREVLRKGILNEACLEKVDTFSEAILHVSGETGTATPEWQKTLLEFLADCAPGEAEKNRIHRLTQKKITDPAELKKALAEVWIDDSSKGHSRGLFQRWFGRADAGPRSDGDELKRHLVQLVKEIEIPPVLAEQSDTLMALMQQDCRIEEALEKTAQLLAAINDHAHQERVEIEHFLEQLTQKLQTLESQTRDVGQLFQAGESVWNEKLSAQVDHLRMQTLKETDLDTLKVAVTERLDILTMQLRSFREAQKHRTLEADQKITALSNRLRELEQESDDLHQRLRVANQQALYDAVTGLPNRQAVDERLAQEFARWQRFNKLFCLLIWDVDHFKRINDSFGHRAGDKALRHVGRMLRDGVRSVDFVGRYGGEEFLMLLPETNLDGALKVAEKLRGAIKNCGFNSRGKPISLTISCGISCVLDEDTPQSLFERADQALYQAKEGGRDRCLCGQPS